MTNPKEHFAELVEKIHAMFREPQTEVVEQWGPQSVTFIVRHESNESIGAKLLWAQLNVETVIDLAPCSYASFNANARVASFSAMFWIPKETA